MATPQYFSVLSTTPIVSSSSGSSFYPFGFAARRVEIENLGATEKPIYVKLGSSSTGSTGDLVVTSCVSGLPNMITIDLGEGFRFEQVRLFATSTAGNQFAIRAVG